MSDGLDPRLPILAELEEDVRRAAERRLGGEPAARRDRVVTRASRRRGSGRRVVRRALALVALVLLVGATALAATGTFDGGGGDVAVSGSAVVVAHGAAGGGYRFVLHRHGRRLCRLMVVADTVTSDCRRSPRGRGVEAESALAGNDRLLFGVTGPRLRAVTITLGGHHREIATRPVDAAAARAAGLDPGLRVFVVSFPADPGRDQPPALVDGRPDCSLTTVPTGSCSFR